MLCDMHVVVNAVLGLPPWPPKLGHQAEGPRPQLAQGSTELFIGLVELPTSQPRPTTLGQ